jgi:O-antigen/teichoic acid export membrane protein
MITHKSSFLAFISDFIGVMLFTIIQIFLTPYIIENVGEDGLGNWLALVSFYGLITLVEFGTNSTTLQRSIKIFSLSKISLLENFLSTSLYIKFSLSILAILLSVALYELNYFQQSFSRPIYYSYAAWIFLLIGYFGLYHSYLSSIGLLYVSNALNNMVLIFTYVFGSFLIYLGFGIQYFAIVQLVLGLIATILSYALSRRSFNQNSINLSLTNVRYKYVSPILKRSMNYFKLSAATKIFSNIDNILIGILIGPEMVAIYFISIRAASLISPNIVRISGAMLPFYAKQFSSAIKSSINEFTIVAIRIITRLSIFGAIFIYLLNDMFITLWMDASYLQNDMFKLLLAFLVFRDSLVKSLTQIIMATGNIASLSNFAILESLVKIVISIFLINYYGIYGALLATVIASSLFTPWVSFKILSNILKQNEKKKFILKTVLFPILEAIPSVLIILFSSFYLFNDFSWGSIISLTLITGAIFFINSDIIYLIKKYYAKSKTL